MKHQEVSNYGSECPVCHGSGWELYELTDKAQPYAKPCKLCRISRRSEDITGVPPQFRFTDLSRFDFNAYSVDMAEIKKFVQSYFDKFKECRKSGKGLYLWSKTSGSGKTFLSCCLGKSIMIRYDLQMRFITAPDYIAMVGDSYKRQPGERDESQIYRECELLIFDDIGSQKSGDWQTQEIFRLVNERMNAGKVTLYTSNMAPDSLNVDSRTIDRIRKASLDVMMPEESIRSKLADAEQEAFLKQLLG
ncbi:MAG: ATP-binding protein [Lachnospiraceae bacterium]|nr:ATP-binding protein [Lachnospiraceae bacterium]